MKLEQNQLKQLEADNEELNNNIKNELTEEPEEQQKGKGRKKGQKTKKYNYYIEVYDIFNNKFFKLAEYFTFEDMAEQLEIKHKLIYSKFQLQNIYNNKTSDQWLKIYHL